MMSLDQFELRSRELARLFTNLLNKAGIGADKVALGALVLSAASGMLVALFPEGSGPLIFMAVVLFLRAAVASSVAPPVLSPNPPGGEDSIALSRQLLEEIAGVAADMIQFLPLVLVPEFSPVLVTLVVIMAVLTETAGIAATTIGGTRRHDGPMGRSERALAIAALVLLGGIGILPAVLINMTLAVIVGMSFLTLVNRVNAALEGHGARAQAEADAAAAAGKAPKSAEPTPE